MEWTVRIEGKPEQRIKVRFEPTEELLHYIGQYKIKNGLWTTFSEMVTRIDTTLEEIQLTLAGTYDLMDKRIKEYKNIDEGFSIIKTIEIKTEE